MKQAALVSGDCRSFGRSTWSAWRRDFPAGAGVFRPAGPGSRRPSGSLSHGFARPPRDPGAGDRLPRRTRPGRRDRPTRRRRRDRPPGARPMHDYQRSGPLPPRGDPLGRPYAPGGASRLRLHRAGELLRSARPEAGRGVLRASLHDRWSGTRMPGLRPGYRPVAPGGRRQINTTMHEVRSSASNRYSSGASAHRYASTAAILSISRSSTPIPRRRSGRPST